MKWKAEGKEPTDEVSKVQSFGMTIREPLYVLLLRRPMKDMIQYNGRINQRRKDTGSWKQNRKKKRKISQNNCEWKFLENSNAVSQESKIPNGRRKSALEGGAKKRKIKLKEELACLGIKRLSALSDSLGVKE